MLAELSITRAITLVTDTTTGQTVGADGPVYINSPLIFNPDKKKEVWRFLSYMLVHSGYFHITFNVVVQVRETTGKY